MGRLASVSRDNRGLTLIEVMISLAILFIVFIGLLETVRVATEFNLRNAVNSEAIRIADNTIASYRAMVFDNIPTTAQASQISRRVRRTTVTFNIQVNPTGGTITRTINVTVTPIAPSRFSVVRPTSFTTVIRNPRAL